MSKVCLPKMGLRILDAEPNCSAASACEHNRMPTDATTFAETGAALSGRKTSTCARSPSTAQVNTPRANDGRNPTWSPSEIRCGITATGR